MLFTHSETAPLVYPRCSWLLPGASKQTPHSSQSTTTKTNLRALYAMLATSAPAAQMGTFRERLEACLGNYKVKELEKALIRGQKLHQLMFANDQMAAQMSIPPRRTIASAFRHEEAILANGYNGAAAECEDPELLGILSDILRQDSVDLSIFGGTYSIEHELLMPAHEVGSDYYPEATAKFSQVINPIGGIIIACQNMSPAGANREAERPLRHGFSSKAATRFHCIKPAIRAAP